MDRLVWTALSGAKNLMYRQDVVANNLANASTPGFRAETSAFRSQAVAGPGQPTRHFAVETTTGADLTPGPVMNTGRDLDVAVQGPGWLAVMGPDGREAYTRAGAMQVGAQGVLETPRGFAVMGEGGPISVPPDHGVTIARDGTISAVPIGQPLTNAVQLGRLKLVNPPEGSLVRGDDALFRTKNRAPAEADPNVAVASRALEGSNVNAAEAMVTMIGLARQFEAQMKMLTTAEDNARKSASLLGMGQ